MKNLPKIIALYLPQFHRIPENDKFWGEGFTDWVTVKKAKPLFEGHQQPRVPLNDNYYDLSQKENVAWQAKLAKEYGIHGFGIYHYWFNNEQNLLTKPSEIIRDNDDIDINYCFVWDNASWKRSWSNVAGNAWAPIADGKEHKGPQILIEHILGGEKDWENHFNYLLTHFKSNKYIKVDNKPVFCIYGPNENIYQMCEYWDRLAKQAGFDGIHIVYQCGGHNDIPNTYHTYKYEPHSSSWYDKGLLCKIQDKLFKYSHLTPELTFYDYDSIWTKLLKKASRDTNHNVYFGAFAHYDDTPRRGRHGGKIVKGSTPEKFEKYFSDLVQISSSQNKDFIFLTAWNEWGEGAYIEPDTIYGYKYLEAVRKSIDN